MAPTTIRTALQAAAINVSFTGSGTLVQGQTGATFTITVGNRAGSSLTSGAVAVTVTLAAGLTPVSISGAGWNCSGATCSRSDPLPSGSSYPAINLVADVASNAASPLLSTASVALTRQAVATATVQTEVCAPDVACPMINPGGGVPVYSASGTIQPGSWVSVYGTGLAAAEALWDGSFLTSLGGVSVIIDSKPAYLWYVSPNQINLQAPDDSVTGTVNITVTTAGKSTSSLANLGPYGPSFSLFNARYPAAIVPTPGSPGNSGGGYDIIGPPAAFPFPSRPVKVGETVVLYGVGFGPTSPVTPAGQIVTSPAPSVVQLQVSIGDVPASVQFAGITEAGLFQFNVMVPEVASGLQAMVANISTQNNVYITVQ